MKAIERKKYYQPAIRIIKLQQIRPLATSTIEDDTGGQSTPVQSSRSFIFEDEE